MCLQDLRIHNVGSWSNLANAASNKPNKPAPRSSSSFEMFRKAALEKETREKQMKAQEHLRKQQKQQAELERQRLERERQRYRIE